MVEQMDPTIAVLHFCEHLIELLLLFSSEVVSCPLLEASKPTTPKPVFALLREKELSNRNSKVTAATDASPDIT